MTRESIRALVDAATPGPWTTWKWAVEVREGVAVAAVGPLAQGTEWEPSLDNAAFIAASRTAVPLLLAVADAAAEVAGMMPSDRCPACGHWYERGLIEHGEKCPVFALYAVLAALEATDV